ncbi:hypothetical protein [Rhodococcus sp. NPDC076796]|uniref:hypothetical protein n=1 Tax=Rhodococcus sp. NPDC076796 TaxID=3154859 RepID=UPI002ADBA3DF|nr:hypothetical protein [Rhodococcus sp. (in: high G+C Gram-positive bacteria)]
MTNRTVPNRLRHNDERRRILDAGTANRLAHSATLARLIGHDHFGPTVDVVPCIWIGSRVYFYAEGRSQLGRSMLDSSVVLEFDAENSARATVSTVVVHGIARAVLDARREVLEQALPRPHSEEPPMHRLVEVAPTSVSGVELTCSDRSTHPTTNDAPRRTTTMTDDEAAAVPGTVVLGSESITVDIPTGTGPRVFPVTTAAIGGVVHAVMIAEYGPIGGVSPDGHVLATAVLDRWPDARVFERRSTGDRGADPRGYESFYVELDSSGRRSDADLEAVSALFR